VPSPGRSAAPACVNNRLVSSTPRHMMPRTCATQSALVRCGWSLTEPGSTRKPIDTEPYTLSPYGGAGRKEYPNKAKNGCIYVFDVWDDHVHVPV
jgi:hypothetical protein